MVKICHKLESQLVKKKNALFYSVVGQAKKGQSFGSDCIQMPMNGRDAPATTAGSGIKLAPKKPSADLFCVKRENCENPPPGQAGRVCLWWSGILHDTAKCP